MLLAIVNMKAGNYYLQKAFLEPLQEMASSFTPSLLSDDSGKHGIGAHKPPKASYSIRECFSGFAYLFHIPSPSASLICFSEPYKALPEVFAEITVPPKILPHTTIIFYS
jgi:hypothetical protein